MIYTNKIIRWKKKVSSHLEKVRLPDVVGAKVIGIDGKKDKNSLTMVTIEGQDGDLFIQRQHTTLDHHTFTINSGIIKNYFYILITYNK